MLVVTTGEIHGWDVQRVCGEVYGVALRGRIAPGHDGERALADSRTEVISRMLEHARVKGGNLVIGLRFDTAELGDGLTELCAYGTAVVAIPVDEGAKQTATTLGYGQPGATTTAEPVAAQPQHDPAQQYGQQYPQQQYDPNQQYAQQYGQQQYPGQPTQGQPYPAQGYPQQQQPGYQQYPQQGYPQR